MSAFIAPAMIAAYLVTTTIVGVLMVRRSRDSDGWAVAGGGMGLAMIVVGVAGTRIGGAATYGVAADVISGGIWNLWWYGLATFLALALVGLFFAVPYRRLNIQTPGEVFALRFGSRRCQWMTSLCVQTEYAIVNIIEPYVIGRILQTVLGIPFGAAVLLGGLIIVTYTALGGLWGAASTNLVHCGAMLLGLTAVGLAGLSHLGGWPGVTAGVNDTLKASGIDAADWWGITGAGWLPIVAMVFSAAIHTPAASVYVNFATAARHERLVRPAYLLGGLVAAPVPLLAGWIGIETLAKYGTTAQMSSYQTITRLATEINPWLGGIALAAVLAAVISSGGPILLSSATMLVRDWFPGSAQLGQTTKLRAYRTTTVVYGLLAAVIAWLGPIGSILELLLFGFAMVVPPAIAIAYVVYWPRTTEAGTFWGIALGYASGLGWYLAMGDTFDPSYLTTIVPLVLVPLVSLCTRESLDGRDAFYRTIATAPHAAVR